MSRLRTLDRHRPFIDLLDRPAVTAWDDPLAFRRLRAQAERVRRWYAERTGWTLVQRRDVFRLIKTPALTSPGHGFRWAEDRLDYELAVWVLWYGEATGAETFVLTHLTEEIEARANELVGPGHLSWDVYAHRLSMRRALAGLEAIGVLRRLDGDAQKWAEDRSGNSMYEFTPLLRHFYVELPTRIVGEIGAPVPAEEVAAALEPGAASPLAQSVPPEQRLYRTLLLSPALFRADDPEAFDLLAHGERRRRIAEDLQDAFGWDLEVTSAYACLLRPSASEVSETALFPIQGALSHVILLLFAELRDRVRRGLLEPDAYDRLRLTQAQLASMVTELRARYGEHWGATMAQLGTRALVQEVLEALTEWDLLRGPDADGQWYVMPLAARFSGAYAGAEAGDGDVPENADEVEREARAQP
ncbi:MAG: TIGR02678 family protein [Firmicutes bacterium]|nr:TIGR02678 family protein [Bacillota bacterium]